MQFEAHGVTIRQGEALEHQLLGIGVLHQVLQLIPLVIGQMGRGDLEGSTVEAGFELDTLEQALGPSQGLSVAQVKLLAVLSRTDGIDNCADLPIARVESLQVVGHRFGLDR